MQVVIFDLIVINIDDIKNYVEDRKKLFVNARISNKNKNYGIAILNDIYMFFK